MCFVYFIVIFSPVLVCCSLKWFWMTREQLLLMLWRCDAVDETKIMQTVKHVLRVHFGDNLQTLNPFSLNVEIAVEIEQNHTMLLNFCCYCTWFYECCIYMMLADLCDNYYFYFLCHFVLCYIYFLSWYRHTEVYRTLVWIKTVKRELFV